MVNSLWAPGLIGTRSFLCFITLSLVSAITSLYILPDHTNIEEVASVESNCRGGGIGLHWLRRSRYSLPHLSPHHLKDATNDLVWLR